MDTRPDLPPLDPKIDVVFKALFGRQQNIDLLTSLLNGVLELEDRDRLVSVEILSPISELESSDEKLCVLDLSVRDQHGRQYVVEMQCRNHKAFPERMLYYGTRRYGEQLRSGDTYSRLRPVVVLIFTDFALFSGEEGWRHEFALRAEQSSLVFSAHLRIVVVELPKFRKKPPEALGLGESWVCFLKEGCAMTRTIDEPWVTPALRKAMEELERLKGDEVVRQRYEARLRQVQIWATELEGRYEEGREEGREEGQQEARRLLAQKLRSEGETDERISRLTGLSAEEIEALS